LVLSVPHAALADAPGTPALRKVGTGETEGAKSEGIHEIAEKVSALRGLPLKKEITEKRLSKDQITRRLHERIAEEYDAAELDGEERAFKRLGLLPAALDYRDTVVRLLTEQIAGFYDPKTHELYIADWIETDAQRVVLAHEILHALQDQSFDLSTFIKPIKDNGDEQLARQALVEGDGTALMIEFMLKEQGHDADPWANETLLSMLSSPDTMAGMKELDEAPLFLRDSLMFPYTGGLRLIASIRRHHPWRAVDVLFGRPPASTEQVLHPEKYQANEKPVRVPTAAFPPMKGFRILYQNVVGELMWDVFFRQHSVTEARAKVAAAGWGGDRVVVYAPTDEDGKGLSELIAVGLVAWDAEADAVEAFAALGDALSSLTAAATPNEKRATFVSYADPTGDVAFVERRGARTVFVVGAPAGGVDRIRKDVWATWKAKP
jgi:hypothetical protein